MTIKTYAQFNIGRNVGTTPMSLERWSAFISDACHALSMSALRADGQTLMDIEPRVEIHKGKGTWIDTNGNEIMEDSAHISLYWSDGPLPWQTGFDLGKIRYYAAQLASDYDQDLVAVITN